MVNRRKPSLKTYCVTLSWTFAITECPDEKVAIRRAKRMFVAIGDGPETATAEATELED